MIVLADLWHLRVGSRLHVDHADQKQSVVRGERAARLADDVRHGQLHVAAHLAQCVYNVVRVFLQRIVHARLRRGLRAVVVHAKTATDVHVRDVEPHRAQLGVVPREFLKSRLDEADVGDLRTEVAVDQLDDVELSRGGELVDDLHELGRAEPEF